MRAGVSGTLFHAQIPGDALMLNNMYINVPRRGRVLSSKARVWKVSALSALAAFPGLQQPPAANGRLALELTFRGRWQNKKGEPLKKDVSNAVKAVEDVLCEYLGIDDRHIYQLSACKVHDDPGEACITLVLRGLS